MVRELLLSLSEPLRERLLSLNVCFCKGKSELCSVLKLKLQHPYLKLTCAPRSYIPTDAEPVLKHTYE